MAERQSGTTLGFVGLGHMGGNMAARLLAAGYLVVGESRHREGAQRLVDEGLSWCDTPRAVAEVAESRGGAALDPRDRGNQPPGEMSTFPTAPLSTAECAAAVSSRPKRCSGRPNSSPTWNAPSSIARLMSAPAAAIRSQPTV
jgi:hypothetical protein